jgi:hypothetical protein
MGCAEIWRGSELEVVMSISIQSGLTKICDTSHRKPPQYRLPKTRQRLPYLIRIGEKGKVSNQCLLIQVYYLVLGRY